MYKFSVPMPLKKEFIDRLIEINGKIKKSKITSLYFAMPYNCPDVTGFEQSRVFYRLLNNNGGFFDPDFEFYKNLILYAKDNGFDFIYLLNSPKAFEMDELPLLQKKLKKLDNLLNKLRDIGVDKIRLASTQLISYISEHYPDFKIYASTSMEYTQMKSYEYLMETFPNIVEIVPSFDVNKNFLMLKNLKKKYPDVEIELMVNEGCIAGCPFRNHHNQAVASLPMLEDNPQLDTLPFSIPMELSFIMYPSLCGRLSDKHFFELICKSNLIYPWQLDEYAKIGIDNFKLVGRNNDQFQSGEYLHFYDVYLRGVDSYDDIEYEEFKCLNNFLVATPVDLKIYQMRPYLPDIKHFVKNGHLCASSCGVSCRYCFNCAKKLSDRYNLEFYKNQPN